MEKVNINTHTKNKKKLSTCVNNAGESLKKSLKKVVRFSFLPKGTVIE